MKTTTVFILILGIIILGILIFQILNFRSLRHLKNTRLLYDTQLNDSKYFELKYKYEFLVAIISMVVAVLAFIGYDSYKSLQESMRKDIELVIDKQKDSLNRLNNNVAELGMLINQQYIAFQKSSTDMKQFEIRQKQFNDNLKSDKLSAIGLQQRIFEIKSELNTVQNKNIIRQELYIVKDLQYPLSADWIPRKVEFKEMRTINNELLPDFKEPPIIFPFSNNGITYNISNVTTTSFMITAQANANLEVLPTNSPYSILISVIK